MNVGELIRLLKQHPKDLSIIMAADAEGNGYTKLDANSISYAYYRQTEFEIEVKNPEDSDIGDSPCLILYP